MRQLCACCVSAAERLREPISDREPPIATETETVGTIQPVGTAALTEAAPEDSGFLFLTMSKLIFSAVGEQEDVYVGPVPRDAVHWVSADPAVVSVENSVLAATGVGNTTVAGIYGDLQVRCSVGCIADSEEALHELDEYTLRSPQEDAFPGGELASELF